MIHGSLNPNITFLDEKLTGCLKQKFGKKSKNAYKKRKNENFEKQKMRFFSHVPRITQPKKISFLGQKVCPAARERADRHTRK